MERRAKDLHISTPEVYEAKVFVPDNTSDLDSIGARLVIAESQLPILHNRSFWPRPAYARPWNFQKRGQGAVLEVDRSKNEEDSEKQPKATEAKEAASPEVDFAAAEITGDQ